MLKLPRAVQLSNEERALGMARADVTRRDFVGGSLAGAGLGLLAPTATSAAARKQKHSAPVVGPRIDPAEEAAFNGFGGVGDYAASHGNMWRVLSSAHQIRDGAYQPAILNSAGDTGESYDLIIVGGGAAGLGAARAFIKQTGGKGRALLLDNHPVIGGEAKQNEFIVGGTRLLAPQGSNLIFTASAPAPSGEEDYMFRDLTDMGIPTSFSYATLEGTSKALQFDRTNYMFLYDQDHSDSVGLFTDDDVFGHGRRWLNNPYKNELKGIDIPEPLRAEMMRFRHGLDLPRPPGPDTDRWLDTITYRQLLTDVHQLPTAVADYMEPFVASGIGLGSSVVSAYSAVRQLPLPGGGTKGDGRVFRDLSATNFGGLEVNGFPGGNGTIARAYLNSINPQAIVGGGDFDQLITGRIASDRLDAIGAPVRIRTASTVVDVRHVIKAGQTDKVRITYERGGRLFRTDAKAVVMANGGWVNKHIVFDMPAAIRAAYDSFRYSSVIVANVALNNWRFLEQLGLTSCIYTGGEFGFSCNIRRPMHVGGFAPPLDPGKPAVLTFYAPYTYPGEDAATQGANSRAEIFGTSYRDYEQKIRRQLVRLFGAAGFDPQRDVEGIILNRWGHAYIVPEPGFAFGRDGQEPASEVIRRGFGRIRFGAAELRGEQNFRGAVHEGTRAVQQLSQYF